MFEIPPPLSGLFWGLVFFTGGAFGSFLCVCVRRIPLGISVTAPSSVCDSCSKPVPFYANIPVAGFIICRGKCLRCRNQISILYPVVETICAAGAVCAVYFSGLSFEALKQFVFLYALVAASAFDLSDMKVPDFITLPFCAAGIVFSILSGYFTDSLAGAAVGGGVPFTAAIFYKTVRKKDGMGMGDVKLMAGIGAFVGPTDVLKVIFAASVVGAIGGFIYLKMRGQKSSRIFPFAPFIAVCAGYFFFAP